MRVLRMKVKLSPCLIKLYTMKTYGGVQVYFHAFLSSASARDEWSVSRPGRFNTAKRASVIRWMGDIPCLCRESQPDYLVEPVA
jgi:hypothetical protein